MLDAALRFKQDALFIKRQELAFLHEDSSVDDDRVDRRCIGRIDEQRYGIVTRHPCGTRHIEEDDVRFITLFQEPYIGKTDSLCPVRRCRGTGVCRDLKQDILYHQILKYLHCQI